MAGVDKNADSEKTGRKEQEKQRHRQEILAAAAAVFAEKDYFSTTMEDIARKAEFSVGTLYNFFTGKEQLYQSLIEERLEQFSDTLHGQLDICKSPLEAVRLHIELRCKMAFDNADYVRIYTRQRMNDRFINSPLWTNKVGPLFEDMIDRMKDIFRAGQEGGIFRSDVSPYDMAISLDAVCDGFLYEWLLHPDKITLTDKCASITSIFLDGVVKK